MTYKITVKDEDTGEWRDADESDGLSEPNSFSSKFDAGDAAHAMVRRCAYRFAFKIVKN